LAAKEQRINEMIQVREVRLIDEKGGQRGIVPTAQAMEIARQVGLDLVEVSPGANPPVCKLLDYGKFKFEQEKKLRESRKRQKLVKMKEIRMQPKIEEHDLAFKTKHIRSSSTTGSKSRSRSAFADGSWPTPNSGATCSSEFWRCSRTASSWTGLRRWKAA
jgi:translation initiation factor IF-3